jgi:uncharacterized repeat protein (TIGR01451 family)
MKTVSALGRCIVLIALIINGLVAFAAPPQPDLAVTMTALPNTASVGEIVTYSLFVTNAGKASATQVHLVSTLSSNSTFFSATLPQGTFTQSNNVVDCNLGTMSSGAGFMVQIAAFGLTNAGTIYNSALITTVDSETTQANNSAVQAVTVSPFTFYPGPNLNTGRVYHVGTSLADGRVLFTGGLSSGTRLASAEIYDPQTKTITPTGSMNFARNSHAGTLLADGTVLITGGVGATTSAEIFNPATGTFTVVSNMNNGHVNHSATLLQDGRVLVEGNSGDAPFNSAEIYTPSTHTFTKIADKNYGTYYHKAFRLADGKVLLPAGADGNSYSDQKVCELYDPVANTFVPTAPLNYVRSMFGGTTLLDGRIFVAGGNYGWQTGEWFDTNSQTWTACTNLMTTTHYFATASLLPDGKVLVAGYTVDTDLFDPLANKFGRAAKMIRARNYYTANTLPDGSIIFAGGDGYLASTEIYDPTRTKAPPALSVSDASVVEGNSGSTNLIFNVTLSSPMGIPVSVNFNTGSASAVAGSDFVGTNGTLLFPPGVTNQTITVTVLADVDYEGDETFPLALYNPSNAVLDLAHATGTGTIINDDVPPTIAISPASRYEGNVGTTNIVLNVSLSGASYQTITVNYATVDGTATAGSDYVATNGVLTFSPETTNQTVSVIINGDLQVEPNETFTVQLSNPTNATIATASATATILDDDGTPGFVHHFEIVLPTNAIYSTAPTPFTINARDFGGGIATNFSGRVLLMVGFGDEAPQHFGFEDGQLGDWTPTYGGSQPGPYEVKYFNVTASNEFSMAFRTAAGYGTDGIVRQVPLRAGRHYFVTGDFAESNEGGGQNGGDTVANLVLNNFTLGQYHFGGVNGGQVLRTNLGGYFDAPTTATYPLALLFSRDPWSEYYPVGAFADDIVIGAGSITPRFTAHFVNGVWSGTNAIGAPGTNYVLYAKDVEGHIGNSSVFAVQPIGDVVLRTVVTPTTPRVGSNVVVTLNVTNVGPGTASAVVVTNAMPPELQFVSATSTSGSCTVSNGVVFCNIGDLALNQSASVTVTMRPVTFGTVTNVAGAWPISFDPQPTNNTSTTNIVINPALIFVSDVTLMEATNATTNAVFTVTVGDPHSDTITVSYATADVTATAGQDYIATAGQLTFAPGVSTQTVSVAVLDDTLAEFTETFRLQLSSPTNAALAGTGYGTANILDNGDPWPQIAINDISVNEGDFGTISATFTVTFDRPAGSAITLMYSTTNGTAVSTNDYNGVTNSSLTFTAGQTNRTLTIAVRGDTVNEPDETFTVALSLNANNPNSGTFTKRIGTCTILNDDAVPGRLDHFAWTVSSPQFANLPFTASLMAQDAFNNAVTNSLTSVSIPLSATFGTNGVKTTLTPTSASGFTNSVWNGTLTLTATNSPIVLLANDGQGHIGNSIPITVLPPIATSLLLPASVTEGDGVIVNGGTLTVATARGVNTTFALSSSDTSELIVPANVVLPAGQTNVSFDLTVADDATIDGTHNATITASTPGYVTSAVAVPVHDNETALLSVSAPATVSESAGTVTGTVTIRSPHGDSVQVFLTSSDTTEIQVPSSIVVPAGQTSIAFNITVINDIELDGPQTARITAHVQNWTDGFADITVADDDTNTVFVAFSAPGATFFEGSGAVSATVRLGGTVTSNVTVSLTSSMPNKLSVASSVVVPAGSNSVLLPITVPDDSNFDGTQIVTITPSATGFFSIPTNVTVADNDLHHFSFSPIPSNVEATVPLSLTVYAKDINDVTISNFSGTISFTASNASGPVPLSLSSVSLTAGQWSGTVTVPNWEFVDVRFIASNAAVASQSPAFNVTAPRVSTISWPASELVYSPLTQRIYMNATSTGNLTPLNPFQMTVETSVNIGSLGGKMVIADSGEYIYLERGGGYISRFNVASNAPDLFWNCGAPQIEDMAAVPNWPTAVAVARMDTSTSPRTRGTIIFDNNTALPNGGGGNVIEFVSPTRAYIYNNETTGFDFRRYNVNSNGLNFESSIGLLSGFGVNFSCRAGLVFASTGQIADGERGIQIGSSPSGMMIAGSTTEGRFYSVTSNSLTAWDVHTLLPVGTMTFSAVGTPTGNLIRWSTNGLAFRTASSQVAILRTGLVPAGAPTDLQLSETSADPSASVGNNYACTFSISNAGPNIATNVVFSQTVPAIAGLILVSSPGSTTATVSGGFTCTIPSIAPGAATLVSVTVKPAKPGVMGWRVGVTSGTADPNLNNNRLSLNAPVTFVTAYDSITEFTLPANDLGYDAVHGTVCASVPNANWLLGNSVATFDPLSGAYPSLIPTAIEPNKLAIADNGQYVYASLGSEASIQRINLLTRVADLKFPTGYNGVNDMEVMPGHAEVLAATVHTTVAIYDNGVIRPNVVSPTPYNFGYALEFGATSNRLYATFPTGFRRIDVNANGATLLDDNYSLLPYTFSYDIDYNGNRLYAANGTVIDPENETVVTTLPYTGLAVGDASAGRAYFLTASGSTAVIHVLNLPSYSELKSITVTNVSGSCASLIRCGADGLAFRTTGGQVFLVRTTSADDRDWDGMADAWEIAHFGSINAPGGGPSDDPDGDGLSNLDEFRAGTDPMNAQSVLRISAIQVASGQFRVSFPTVAGKKYRVESSATLGAGSWSIVADNVAGTGDNIEIAISPLTNSSAFLRLILVP